MKKLSNNGVRSSPVTTRATGVMIWRWAREHLELVIPFIIGIIIITFFTVSLVPTSSMTPYCEAGNFTVCARIWDKDNIERGTPVTFHFMEDSIWCKRVIGLPGETVEFRDGYVYINGSKLDESAYLAEDIKTYSDVSVFVVPENSYFLLGDNRGNSYDARYWDDPYILCTDIVARIILPLNIFDARG